MPELRENFGVRLLFGIALIASAVVVLLVFPGEFEVRGATLGFLALLSIPLCAWRGIDIFSPLAILAFSFYFYCFVGPLNLLLTDHAYFYSVNVVDQYGPLFLLVSLGLAGALAGWYFGRSRRKPTVSDYNDNVCLFGGVSYCAMSIASFTLYYFLSGTFVDRSRLLPEFETRAEVVTLGYLLQGLDLCLPGLVLLSASGRRWVRRLAYALGAVLLVIAITTGFRANVVKTVFPLFLMRYVRSGRRPSARVCLVVALCALLGFAAIGYLRSNSGSLLEALSNGTLLERDLLLSDLNTIQAMSLVLAKVPEQIDYLWGESLLYVPVHVLPRSLYPDKGVAPEVQLVWDITDKNAGFALPLFGLFYLNFGYAGAAAGMFLVGWVLSRFYARYQSDPNNRRLQAYLVVISLLVYLVFPRHSLVQVLTQSVYSLAPLLVIDLIQFSPRLVRELTSARQSAVVEFGGTR